MAHSQVARTARRRGAESCGPQGAPVVSQAGSASGPALPNQVNSKSGGCSPSPLFSEHRAHFVRPASRTCSTGELSGAATGQEVLLARAVAVETAEEAAVDARRSFLKRASEGTRRPSLASPLVSEVAL